MTLKLGQGHYRLIGIPIHSQLHYAIQYKWWLLNNVHNKEARRDGQQRDRQTDNRDRQMGQYTEHNNT